MANFFNELAAVLLIVFAVSLVMKKIKQPLLIGYILTGVFAGPLFLNILSSQEGYETFAHIGVALLLFIVGLHLNVRLVKEVGLISLVTGVGQIVFTTLVGMIINYFLGFDFIQSVLIAVALTFSSTIIIVKLLTDLHAMEKLYGKISMGFLLVQDIVAVVLLMIIGSVSETSSMQSVFVQAMIFSVGAIIITFLLSKYVIPKFLSWMSSSNELLFVFTMAWCFGISVLSTRFGFSLEIGALLAGVVLASSDYQHEISSRIKPLRDFFLIMFFVFLGSQLIPMAPEMFDVGMFERLSFVGDTMGPIFSKAILLSLFVLIGNPLIVFFLVTSFGYSSKTAFLSGLAVSQISEFSFIFMILAQQVGLVQIADVSLVTFVAIITIISSTYMMMNGEKLYKFFKPVLVPFEKQHLKDSVKGIQGKAHDMILFGANRIGFSLLESMNKLQKKVLIVDHNPQFVKTYSHKGYEAVFGDASNIEFISEFDFKDATMVISTIPDFETNEMILENAHEKNKKLQLIVTAQTIDEALELYEIGADYVILPHFLGGHYVSTLIEEYHGDTNRFLKEKVSHMKELEKRKKVGHEHPAH